MKVLALLAVCLALAVASSSPTTSTSSSSTSSSSYSSYSTSSSSTSPNAPPVYLVLGYCKSAFTSAGAVVTVDVATGNYTIVGTFDWPSSAIFGCLYDYDPTVTVDIPSATAYFDFTSDEGLTVSVDLTTASVVSTINPHDSFFTGYTNFLLDGNDLLGLTGTVTQSGYCSDGCFGWGRVELNNNNHYSQMSTIPFKGCLDDSHVTVGDVFYTQCSYDLREESEWCAKVNSDECLVSINMTSGDMIDSIFANNYTVYAYGPSQSSSSATTYLAWMEGFESTCKHPYNDFAFGYIDVTTATSELVACIPHDVTVDMDEWINSFSGDGSVFATGSGNDEGDPPQVLVFNSKTGDVMLNSQLHGLAKDLKAYSDLIVVWSVTFLS